MKLGFWMDSPKAMKPETETTAFIMWCASKRGHELFLFDSDGVKGGGGVIRANKMAPSAHPAIEEFWEAVKRAVADPPVTIDVGMLDALLYRKNPPLDREVLMELLRTGRLPFTFNDFRGLLKCADKRNTLDFPHLTPTSRLALDRRDIPDLAACFSREVVCKPLDGFGGKGIVKCMVKDVAVLYEEGPFPFLVQEFIPEVNEGDVRVLLLDGRIIGAMRRVPGSDDFRANVAVGGRVFKHEPTPRERFVCSSLAEPLRRDGIYFAGLDLIGGKLTEINCVSPGGIPRINGLEGSSLQNEVLDFLEQKIYHFHL
jgi:glutathione synthase